MEPKYKYGDEVYIYAHRYGTDDRRMVKLDGVVYIVDRKGTWDNNNEEPSYDIYVRSCNCLYKHITESEVYSYHERD